MSDRISFEVTWFHRDHGLTPDQERRAVCALYGAGDGFHVLTVYSPSPLLNYLFGPRSGDRPAEYEETFYRRRDGREFMNRMILGKPKETHDLTVIGLVAGDQVNVFTAHGGPAAERHPDEPGLTPGERHMSEMFWTKHALITDVPPCSHCGAGNECAQCPGCEAEPGCRCWCGTRDSDDWQAGIRQ